MMLPLLEMENILFYGSFLLYVLGMVLFFAFLIGKKEGAGLWATRAMWAAFACHSLALAARGREPAEFPCQISMSLPPVSPGASPSYS